MSQSSFLTAVLIAAFVLFLAARNRLSTYVQVFYSPSAPLANVGSSSGGSSGGGSGLGDFGSVLGSSGGSSGGSDYSQYIQYAEIAAAFA